MILLLAALSSRGFAAGPMVYVGNFKDNTVSVLDSATHSVVATIPVAAGPHGMALTRDGRWLFVSSDGSTKVNVIDTSINQVTNALEVGQTPHGLALTPDGQWLLAAINGEDRVAFIDVAKQAVVGTVKVAKPHTISIRPDGQVAFVTSQTPGHSALVVIDLSKRTVLRSIPVDKVPRDLEFDPSGKEVYFTEAGVNALEVLDTTSDKIVAEVPTGVSPHYVNHFKGMAMGMAVVQGPGELLLFNPATNQPVRSFTVGKQPHWLALGGDRKTAYVTNEGSNDVSIVNVESGKTTTVPIGNQPRKVVAQQASEDENISIDNFAFTPAVATISVGKSVTWKNDDGSPHTVTFMDGSPGSSPLMPGDTFQRTFDKPGSYDYFCSFHNYMTGVVVVR